MSNVTTGGFVSAIATSTFSNWFSLHLIIVVWSCDLMNLIEALSAAIDPKSSANRFDIALTIISLD